MNVRTTIILLIIFVALGSYYLFVERNKPSEVEQERLARAVFEMERDSIATFNLTYDGQETRCERSESGWEIVNPVQAKADETAMAALLTQISSLEADRSIPAQEMGSPEDFGLDAPFIEIGLTLSSPADSHWVLVGDKTPTGDAYYSFADTRDEIALISSSTVDNNFKKKPFDLRDKTALEFEVDQVVAMQITHGDVELRMERRKDGPWKLVEPIEARGEDTEINSVLFDLKNAKIREFVDEEPADLSPFGLDDPAAVVKLFIGSGRRLMSIKFGGETDEGGTVYALRSGYSNVVEVDTRILDKVKVDQTDLRRKRILDFESADVAAMSISMGDSLFSCAKDSAGEWTALAPENKPLKKWKMNGVSSQVSFLRAFSFVDEAEPDLKEMGLAEPKVIVTVTLSDSNVVSLDLGGVEDDELFVRAGGQVAKVSDDFLQDMIELVRDPPYVEEEEEEGDE